MKKFIDYTVQFTQNKLQMQVHHRKYRNFRRRIEGVVYYLKSGCSLRLVPAYFGSKSIIWYWIRKLAQNGILEQLWQHMIDCTHHVGVIDTTHQSIDCSIIKAPCGGEKTQKNPFDKHKYATKRSIAIDTNGLPIGCAIGSSTRHDSRLLPITILSIPRYIRNLPNTMHLDKAYDSHWSNTVLGNYNYKAVIARRKNRKNVTHIKSRHRWKVERTFSWINRFAGVFTRKSRHVNTYYQLLCLAFAIIIWRKL